MKIAIIGCGTVGGALAKRLAPSHELFLYNRNPEKAEKLALEGYGKACKNISEALQPSELILIAVKPQNISEAAGSISKHLNKNSIVVSLLSGITLHSLMGYFPDISVVRLMPNLAIIYGEGMAAISPNEKVTAEIRENLTKLFEVLGKIYWIPEEKMDAFTALAGSGPAFVYPIIEAMVDAGIAMGFHAQDALDISVNMMQSSLALLKKSQKHPGELKWTISSPKGTTIAGLIKLEESALRAGIINTFLATYERSKELASHGK